MPSNSLEQEAMDRVRRMYSSFDRRPQSQSTPPKPPEKPPEPEPEPKQDPTPPQLPEKPRGMLELLLQDKDQSLIMLLLVILMKDGADMNLLLALIYMLL
ncbi:MAG: hypothetical protein IJ171_01025 [Ruminococcus sp.]|nr:hypothetical protein [Ruminococcus sp.]